MSIFLEILSILGIGLIIYLLVSAYRKSSSKIQSMIAIFFIVFFVASLWFKPSNTNVLIRMMLSITAINFLFNEIVKLLKAKKE